MLEALNIYNYNNLSSYLQDFVKHNSTKNGYSFRSLSLRLKTISHSQLYQIIMGKKKFPIELIRDFCRIILKLNSHETRYFKTLVEINHQTTNQPLAADSDNELYKALTKYRPLPIKAIEFDAICANPLTMIIFELIGRSDIACIDDILHTLALDYPAENIHKSISYLLIAGHITVQEDGMIHKVVEHLMSTNDVSSENIQHYHQEVSRLAINAVANVPLDKREFQSYIINVNKKNIERAKEIIRNFMSDFARELESINTDSDATYNLNVQFFPITKD